MIDFEQVFHSVHNAQFRIWKVMYEDGKVRQNKRQITSPEKLAKFIGNKPSKVYVSVSQFLQPHKVNTKIQDKRPGYKYADRLFLGMDLYFDLDSEKDLTIAQKDAWEIIKYMSKRTDFKLKEVTFSGNKGIKLYYLPVDYNPWQESNPIRRRELAEKRNKDIITDILRKHKLKTIDQNHINITSDAWRVCPATHTYKRFKVQPLDIRQFKQKSIYSLKIPGIKKASEDRNRLRPAKSDDAKVATQTYRDKSRSSLRSYPISYLAIGNYVPGVKNNYVPMMKIHLKDWKKIDYADLSNDIGPYLIFDDEPYFWIISVKCFQKEKLLKIYRRCHAVNISQLQRRYNLFRISNILDNDGNIIKDKPIKVKSISALKTYTSSLAHYKFFKIYYNGLPFILNVIGDNSINKFKVFQNG